MTEDDRMERARRIRRMREGNRSTSDTDEEPDDGRAGDGGHVQQRRDGDDSDAESDAESASDGGAVEADASQSTDSTAEDAWFDEEDAESQSEVAATADTDGDDALAAVESAAAAAAAFEASDVDADDVTASSATEATPETAAESAAESTTESETADPTTAAQAAAEEAESEETRVLEFRLGEEQYCLDIEYVEEIVKEEQVTRVPNTPEFVDGVVDLRGQITTILDPKVTLDVASDQEEQLIIVFDADAFDEQGHIGWIVDEVRQVTPISTADVKQSPIDADYINGVIERDDQFIIWTAPDMAFSDAVDADA